MAPAKYVLFYFFFPLAGFVPQTACDFLALKQQSQCSIWFTLPNTKLTIFFFFKCLNVTKQTSPEKRILTQYLHRHMLTGADHKRNTWENGSPPAVLTLQSFCVLINTHTSSLQQKLDLRDEIFCCRSYVATNHKKENPSCRFRTQSGAFITKSAGSAKYFIEEVTSLQQLSPKNRSHKTEFVLLHIDIPA